MIYIHVPFCRSFCTYCDFFSEVLPKSCNQSLQARMEEKASGYVSRLCQEIRDREEDIRVSRKESVDTLYFGGGTPSTLSVNDFRTILQSLNQMGVKAPFDEFTIEVNPEDILEKGEEYVLGLKELGVDRISMGVQSFDDSMLKWMNRRHDADGAVKAYEILRKCGIANISLDLIFGISHLDDRTWEDSIMKAIALGPEHISAYQLSIEEGSALRKLVERGMYKEADDELCQKQYSTLCRILKENGYRHYEVSNFAKEGFEAKHNSAYWRRLPYAGLGPGAHSFLNRKRLWNSEDTVSWSQDFEILSEEDETIETIMLSLRTADGIDRNWLYAKCDNDTVQGLLRDHNLELVEGNRIRIPEDKFFTSDSIIRALV